MRKKYGSKPLPIPILNDFIYTILYESSYEQKRNLPQKFLKAASNAYSAKKFAAQSTREEKEFLLSHFGFNWFYVVLPKSIKYVELKNKLKEFAKTKKIIANKSFIEEGFYVHGSQEFMYHLRLASQTISHPSYFLNLELNRQGYHIREWSKRNFNSGDMAARECAESDVVLMRTLLSAGLLFNLSTTSFGLPPFILQILIFFYIHRHQYLSTEQIAHYFVGGSGKMFKPNSCKAVMRTLERKGLIHSSARTSKQYTISSAGIQKIADFRDAVLANNDF